MEIRKNKQASEADRALFWVAQAASVKDETRPYFESVLFVRDGQDEAVAVATDGRRVHMARFKVGYVEHVGGVLNNPGFDEWVPTKIHKRNKNVLVIGGEHEDRRYPDYRKVIPGVAYWVDLPSVKPEFVLGVALVAIQDAGYQIPRIKTQYMEEIGEIGPVRVGFDTPEKAHVFQSSQFDPFQRKAVVMPMVRNMEEAESKVFYNPVNA